jgi:hypothetical protein
MKVSNIKCKLKHQISTMVICGSYMFEFSVSKDMKKKKLPSTLADERSTSRKGQVRRHPKNRKSSEIHASHERRWK